MIILQIMQHPAIKAERVDLAYLPPSYHQQQQQLQQQQKQQAQQQQSRTTQQSQNVQHNQNAQPSTKRTATNSVNGNKGDANIETQPDFQSIKGVFGWTVIDKINIPYILRSDKQFVSVRIVEMKLLSRYPNSYPDDLGKQAPLTSFFITANEAKLLNEINLQHCAGEYGKKEFSTKDLIVLLSDFINFYNLVKKTFPDAAVARQEAAETAGWLQIKNTVTPYVKRQENKFVPLSVIKYAAGLLTNESVSGLPPTKRECDLLNQACKTAGVEFVFSDSTTRLINIKDILKISPVDIIELPSSNPLKHATYMELPTTSSRPVEKPKLATSPVQSNLVRPQVQPYMFQPGLQLDMIRTQIQGSVNRPDHNGSRFQIPPQAGIQGNPMANPRMIDPRMQEMYRFQYGTNSRPIMSNGPPNARIGQVPSYNPFVSQVNPMAMQYYTNIQSNQNGRSTVPASQQSKEMSQQRPMSNGPETSPRAQSRPSSGSIPQSGSRPSSTSRPPSGSPLGSPLSPTSFQQFPRSCANVGLSPVADTMTGAQIPMLNGGLAIQQMQNMCSQRFPVSKEQIHSPVSQNQQFIQGISGLSHQDPNIQKHTQLPLPNNSFPPNVQRSVQPSANQEIPGLFSPTGSNVAPPKQNMSTHATAPPPPLQLMSNPTLTSVTKTVSHDLPSINQIISPEVSVTQTSDVVVPVLDDSNTVVSMPAPRNQPLPTTISAAKPQVSLVKCIEGAWLNNKSISCLFLEQDGRNGRYCLVEAVCKLYFNGCSVNEFLFALENVLNVPLITCNEMEEKAFIQYYSLPVVTLKCNKMIKFDDLEKYFPQLTYMFPSKEAIAQSENEVDQTDLPDAVEMTSHTVGMTTEEIEASMPTTMNQMAMQDGDKRPGELLIENFPSKRPRLQGKFKIFVYISKSIFSSSVYIYSILNIMTK